MQFNESPPGEDHFQCSPRNLKSHLFTQAEFDDLFGDLSLIKKQAELLGSRLKEQYLLESGTSIH